MSVVVFDVTSESHAEKSHIKKGDVLISVNGHEINDVLDYRFYVNEKILDLKLLNGNKEEYCVIINKPEYDDIGLIFETYLMDRHKGCKNKCVFCFIDQLPKGMRESLYFKDDDSRLSFLFGNYITLTNLTDKDVSRIINMHISPMNISVHTTNRELRCRLMNNKNAGQSLEYLKQFAAHNIKLNCQIVLCKGLNDGEELENTILDLSEFVPQLQSIAIVPVGLTKHREGLYPLEPFEKEDAQKVIKLVDSIGDKFKAKYGSRICYLADEFYLKAGFEPPKYDYYEDFAQLENGIGLWRTLEDEFKNALSERESCEIPERRVSLITGELAYPLINRLSKLANNHFKGLRTVVFPIKNEFFGERITVAGLVTGTDIIKNLENKNLGSNVLIPEVMLKRDEDVFLDDVTLEELEKKLHAEITKVPNDGYMLLYAMLGE